MDEPFANNYIGSLYLKYDMLKEAVEAYKRAVSKSSDDAVLLNNLSFLLLELNESLPQALELAKRSVELLPNQIFNKDTLAWAYYKNGRYIEALEEINAIRDVVDESPEIHFHYIMILNSMSLLKNPIDLLNKLLADPEVILNKSLSNSIHLAEIKYTPNHNMTKNCFILFCFLFVNTFAFAVLHIDTSYAGVFIIIRGMLKY